MSTADKLDRGLVGGMGSVKERLKNLSDKVKAENEKADAAIKEKDRIHREYCKTIGRQQLLKDKIIAKEEEIERTARKTKEAALRLQEKEQFLEESHKFNAKLDIGSPTEGAAAQKEKDLNFHKLIYSKNNEKCHQAREQKIQLEQQFEQLESRSREVQRKVDTLKQELENNLMEEGRRSEQCKQSIDAAFKCERNCMGLEKMLDDISSRQKTAQKKVSTLREKITKNEDELEETGYERRVVEATIREILIKST